MQIAQITDLHLGFEPNNLDEPNRNRLDKVLLRLSSGINRPDLIVASGDLVDRGDIGSYQRLRDAFSRSTIQIYPIMGNHDDRANFAHVFPEVPLADGFVQYCVALDGLRLIMLDTLEPGRQGGGFCAARAAWLADRLTEDGLTPTVIVMHHPPIEVGIAWMDASPDEPWIQRFGDAVAGNDNIIAIWCGHLHRSIVAAWRGISVSVCASTSAGLTLDLNAIDPEQPDDRSMVINSPPALALHRWVNEQLVTCFDVVENYPVLARFDGKMQGVIRQTIEERQH